MDERYNEQAWWQTYPDMPFATLVALAGTYCNPNTDDDAYPELIALARDGGDPEMRIFKDEIGRVLAGEWFPRQTLDRVVDYEGEDTAEEFLVRLWRDLYPGEPVPRPGRS